jgi:NADPH:quinone reductase-like Zn-dependent oxidoreductase
LLRVFELARVLVRFFNHDVILSSSSTADLMQSGKVTPVIDRRYKLSEVPEAIRYVEEGHAQGKVVITVE